MHNLYTQYGRPGQFIYTMPPRRPATARNENNTDGEAVRRYIFDDRRENLLSSDLPRWYMPCDPQSSTSEVLAYTWSY